MLHIPDSLIVNYSMSPQAYQKGVEYYRGRRVTDIRIQRNRPVIYSKVRGSRDHSVRITFDDDGIFKEARCTCLASREYLGYCQHVVAVLLQLKWLEENDGFRQILLKRKAMKVFDCFQYAPSAEKAGIPLEPVYEYKPDLKGSYGTSSLLYFRIGTGRPYVIRNLRRFLQQLEQGETIEFGKGFTFDPYLHEIDESPLFEFVREVYEANEQAAEGYRSGIFKDKYLCLTDAMAKRFFSIMGDAGFSAVIDGKQVERMRVPDADIPVRFTVAREGEDLSFTVDFGGQITPLTRDASYVLIGGQIYRLSRESLKRLSPFFRVVEQTGEHKFVFTGTDRERFMSEILPYAEKAGEVDLSPDIEEMLVREELRAEVYFDRVKDSIRAGVRFNYGDRTIDPFDPVSNACTGSRILLRDLDRERRILEIFSRYAFVVRPDGIYLEDEDRIFDFFYTGLQRLLEHADVYYSDDFRITVREKGAYTAGVSLSSQTDLLEFTFDMGDIDPDELSRILGALREKKRYYRLKDGSFLPLDDEGLIGISRLLDRLSIGEKDIRQGIIRMPKYRALYLDRLEQAGALRLKRDEGFNTLISDMKKPGDRAIAIPETLRDILRDYQRQGFKWLKTLSRYGFGGILADDMGLGKTLQVLAMILSDKEEGIKEPSLVVAPTSLIYNWEAEIKKFTPRLRSLIITGTKEERVRLMKSIHDVDIVITSYPLVIRDKDDYKGVSFHCCILDEAQHIKNPATRGAKAVKSIKAKRRFALSGTPIENSLTELWSIFDFIMPGYLGSHSKFLSDYERPIVKDGDEEALADLSMHTKPFILRRLKTDVLKELPEKIENVMLAELTEEQKRIYLAYLARARKEITDEVREAGFDKSRMKILTALTRLRQICCHPGVFLENYRGDSGKLILLDEILESALGNGHRILLFSQFTSMLGLINDRLARQGISTLYLDGNTEVKERGRLVKQFNEGEGQVFLISLKAGGTGLNLTGADMVIHFDPWWNPAVEDQASDRAYRIGQTRAVHVMRLITKGTIEEKIEELKEKKRGLADAVITPGESFITAMTEQEVMALFEP
ncbi:MAG TPA: DEAD/DEAH box helicase [Candidatus Atribacteria bacterium]|nr:DEAD/DEAH box helicase [Candidatus Atribacteria bacterium]